MRGYFFGNFYLSSIQQGIQAAHAVTKLFANTPENTKERDMLEEWGNNHVTKILLNGGNQKNLELLFDVFSELAPYCSVPVTKFYEDQDSLGGALTCVGMVLPEEIYSFKMTPDDFLDFVNHYGISNDQRELQDLENIALMLPERRLADSACLLYYAIRTCRLAS